MTTRTVHDAPRPPATALQAPTPRCAHCDAPAAYELLLLGGESFTPPLLSCEFGGRGYAGKKRRLTAADVSGFAASEAGGRG